MPMTYYKTFRVPYWVIVYDNSKIRTIFSWFEKKDARIQEWPTRGFKDAVLSFKKQGWHHIFPKNPEDSFVLHPQLTMMAVEKHLKNIFGPTAVIQFTYPVHRIERTIASDSDYTRIFNEVLALQSPIALSQIFQIAERCHNDRPSSREILWITPAPCVENVLTVLSERVIRVGEGEGYDLDVSNIAAKQIPKFFEEKLTELISR